MDAAASGFSPALIWFVGLALSAFVLGETPLKRPFRWAETYYHELSHGLAAMLTGGRVHRIVLHFNGAGSCTTAGGSRIIILLAGYMGAALWGSALYLGGWYLGQGGGALVLQIELAIMAATVVLWVRDVKTLLILSIIGSMYSLALYYGPSGYLPYLLQFTGLYVLMNAIRAPLHLIDGKSVGDGAELAKIFKILPEAFWIVVWLAFGLACLGFCGIQTVPTLHHIYVNLF